jgi:hypothetical protein
LAHPRAAAARAALPQKAWMACFLGNTGSLCESFHRNPLDS